MAGVEIVDTQSIDNLQTILKNIGSGIVLVHFWTAWAPQCAQINDVLGELAHDPALVGSKFVKVEAETLPELSLKYEITAVPTCIIIKNNKVVDRINGVNIAELTKKIYQHGSPGTVAPSRAADKTANQSINERLKNLVNSSPVMIFIKGSPDAPKCGFSKQLVAILNEQSVTYGHFDILSDEEVRQGLKSYCNWPTYPQLYVKGELIGGLDIVKEMVDSGEFISLVPNGGQSINDRLKALINKDRVMVFIKGSPTEPRCGFSRTLVDILNQAEIKFDHFDILQDELVRQSLKEYSKWPTYPQVYVNGELIGGLDIVKELLESGELASTLAGQ